MDLHRITFSIDRIEGRTRESHQTEWARSDDRLRLVHHEVRERRLRNLGTVTRIQRQTAQAAAATNALIALLAGLHQRTDLRKHIARLRVDATTTSKFALL